MAQCWPRSVSRITLYHKHNKLHEISRTHKPCKEPWLQCKHMETIVSSVWNIMQYLNKSRHRIMIGKGRLAICKHAVNQKVLDYITLQRYSTTGTKYYFRNKSDLIIISKFKDSLTHCYDPRWHYSLIWSSLTFLVQRCKSIGLVNIIPDADLRPV